MKKVFRYYLLLIATIAAGGAALFPIARAVSISMNLGVPNSNTSSTSPAQAVYNIYQFALMIAGILAFGAIVYGGVKYMTSAGNPSGQSDAKEWIESALIGLLLLVGAYFILYVINPQLVNLTLPSLNSINIQGSTESNGQTVEQYFDTQATQNGYSQDEIAECDIAYESEGTGDPAAQGVFDSLGCDTMTTQQKMPAPTSEATPQEQEQINQMEQQINNDSCGGECNTATEQCCGGDICYINSAPCPLSL